MKPNRKVILLRAVRASAATAIATFAAWAAGPEALELVPAGYQFLVAGVLIPALLALEKYVRDGGDATT